MFVIATSLGDRKTIIDVDAHLVSVDRQAWCTVDLVNQLTAVWGVPAATAGTPIQTIDGDDWVTHSNEPVEEE